MAFTDIFKKKKKQPDFVEIGSMAEQGSYGPAGYPEKETNPAEVDLGLPSMPQQQMFAPQSNTAELEKEVKALSYKIDNLKSYGCNGFYTELFYNTYTDRWRL